MSLVPITVPDLLMPKKDLENPCSCQDRPMETLFKRGLVFWIKSTGDVVAKSETICELEIEKKTALLDAPASGILVERRIEDGGAFSHGDILGYIDSTERR